jgi:hypothetical protein
MAVTLMRAEDVGTEFYTRLAGILESNGFETNIGTKVWRGRRKIPADEEVPVCIITEGDDTPGEKLPNKTSRKITQTYVLDAFDACEPDNPNDKAHAMLRDLKKAIFQPDGMFGGKVRNLEYLGRDIGPRPDGAGFVQVRIVVEAEFVENFLSA